MAEILTEGNPDSKVQDEKPSFVTPTEAPIFYPSDTEFADPLSYIAKIRPIAAATGICKIKPPSHWSPPFAVDVDNFRFTPRVQKLNELDANTRIKFNFLDEIAKFWGLQGIILKIPIIDGKALDLYTLYQTVHIEGGFLDANEYKKWPIISQIMGYQVTKNIGMVLKSYYEKLLYPFDLFNEQRKNLEDFKYVVKKRNHKPPHDTEIKTNSSNSINGSPPVEKLHCESENCDPLEKYVCHNCNKGDNEESMLLCDSCDDGYHIFCLIPPLKDIPSGDWCCPKCISEAFAKPMDAFGFEQAHREYSLQQFGEMADKFKTEYFKMECHTVPTSTVEREFWRIISSLEEDVTVEYGADLHAMDHGSGFPTLLSKNLFPGDKEYAESPWNLNNLPVLENSVLRYISADVSGIKVPWMYVGMCFASFCWHSEDHWTYSINYLHWGEAKTWYAVPGQCAELFEAAMTSAAPELFKSQPDLLHQLVTIMNPNILMNAGVPVYRTDQTAGEFVVTFPRAYHAGFNQGYNFAEAVNFAPADWIRIGRECVLHYSKLKRFCVFSHDELLCKMASDPQNLTLNVAMSSYQDMLVMIDTEKSLRKNLLDWGVRQSERVAFESIPDDERQCEVCKTTCFLSAIYCDCSPKILVCLMHFERLCECPSNNKTLKYRYALDEFPKMLKGLKLKSESFDEWIAKVRLVFDPKITNKFYLANLKSLVGEANKNKFPKGELLQHLTCTVKKAEKFAGIIHQLNVYTARSGNNDGTISRINLTELAALKEEIDALPCLLEETKKLEDVLQQAIVFEKTTNQLLSEPLHISQIANLKNSKQYACGMGVEFPNLQKIETRLAQLEWLLKVQNFRQLAHVLDIENVKRFIQKGTQLKPDAVLNEQLVVLNELLKNSEIWEQKAKTLLNSQGNAILVQAEQLLQESSSINCFLPTQRILYEAVEKARDWIKLVEQINLNENKPSFGTVADLVDKGKKLALNMPEIIQFEEHLQLVTIWKQKAVAIFINESSQNSLLKVLTPRTIANQYLESIAKFTIDSKALASIITEAELTETQMMKKLREYNLKKCQNFFKYLFCTCEKGPFDIMIQCELCKNWFHNNCVGVPATETYDLKFLCPNCIRTKRPDKDLVMELLMNLQSLYVSVPEGEVLQCHIKRALNWQERAKTLLDILQESFSWDGDGYVLTINQSRKAQIEEIALEGDLIEITFEESDTIRKLIQSMEPTDRKNIINFNTYIKSSMPEHSYEIIAVPSRQKIQKNDVIDNSESVITEEIVIDDKNETEDDNSNLEMKIEEKIHNFDFEKFLIDL